MRDLKLAMISICALCSMGACGSCGSSTGAASGPTQAELAAAKVSGAWELTVTVDAYSGPPPPSGIRLKPGHQAVDKVWFASQCPSGGACTLQMWGPDGPDPSKQSFYSFYSSNSGLLGPPVSTPMTESGATYSQAIPISGFGGVTCPPSRTVPRPEQRLLLTVTGATHGTAGWSASQVTGTETFIAGWGCGPGGFTGWTVGHLKVTGKAG